ncbi:MAG: hydrolase 1, exosortase A system-associated [Sphingomonadales bacterium]
MPLADERIVSFDVAGSPVMSIVHLPERANGHGILIVPGAPQYRVGPHRLFVDLARQFAHGGVAVMRMDRRGFGDGGGKPAEFEDAGPDIAAALSAFRRTATGLRSVTVLGLCDGASAALLHATTLQAVEGLILFNPWVRGEATDPQAMLGAYYLPRLLRWRRWLAAMSSFARMRGALRGVAGAVLDALRTGRTGGPDFVDQMLRRWIDFPGRSLVVLSGRDIAAAEFDQLVRRTLSWPLATGSSDVAVLRLPNADHTFCARRDRARLAEEILTWLDR